MQNFEEDLISKWGSSLGFRALFLKLRIVVTELKAPQVVCSQDSAQRVPGLLCEGKDGCQQWHGQPDGFGCFVSKKDVDSSIWNLNKDLKL